MKTKLKRICLLVSICFATNLLGFGQTGHADDGNAKFSYSVAIDDANNTSAIQQKVKPGEALNVKLVFANNSGQSQKLKLNFNTAVTGDNGVIQYNFNNLKDRYFGSVNFNHLITGPKEIELGPYQKVIKQYTLTVPKKKFDGVIAGGFYVIQGSSGHQSQQSGVSFKNTIAYAIPIVLHENDRIINTKLGLHSVSAKIDYDYPTVIAKLDNLTPTMFGQMNINAKVVDNNTNKVVFKQQQANMNMAPLTRMSYPIVLNRKLNAGKYKLQLAITSGKAHWHFQNDFTIDAKIASATQKQVHSKSHPPILIYLLFGGLGMAALMVGVYYLGKHRA